MAQNITLLGASYSAVPAVTLPKTGGGTARFDDCTVVTAEAEDVAEGKVFVDADGTITVGTSTGGGGSVTQDAQGYIVLPSQGGGSSPLEIAQLTITVDPSNPGYDWPFEAYVNGQFMMDAEQTGIGYPLIHQQAMQDISDSSTYSGVYNVVLYNGEAVVWTEANITYPACTFSGNIEESSELEEIFMGGPAFVMTGNATLSIARGTM